MVDKAINGMAPLASGYLDGSDNHAKVVAVFLSRRIHK
jgi:hypothetical protein